MPRNRRLVRRCRSPHTVPTAVEPPPLPPLVIDERKRLDQVIIDYLASEAESEHLELSLLNTTEFLCRLDVELRVAAKKSLSPESDSPRQRSR